MTKSIQEDAKNVTKNRAETIARTEILKASNQGCIQGMKEAGMDKYMWITAQDSKVCVLCKRMNKKVQKVNEANTEIPPLHPNCFDEKTEILTENGWKYFKDLSNEKVYTLNMNTNELELQKPIKYINEPYTGNMYSIENESLNIKCTPDHRILMINRNPKKTTYCSKEIKEIAKDLGSKAIPMRNKGIKRERKQQGIEIGDYIFDLEDWAELLGIFLAEGSTSKNGKNKTTQLACYKDREKVFIRNLLNRMNLKYTEEEYRITLFNKQLQEHLRGLSVGANNKEVPEYVFKWDKELIERFINAYYIGDGNRAYWGARRIWTTSKKMADQLQALVLITGGDASISTTYRTKMEIMGRECNAKDIYCIQEHTSQTRGFNAQEKIYIQPYKGRIYCVQTPNDTIIIRRKNKPAIVNNCRCCVVAD